MLQTHLGVRFLLERRAKTIIHELDFTDSDRRLGIVIRLRHAVALGDVGDHSWVSSGSSWQGSTAEVAVGQRINRLVMDFDFHGLNELADALADSKEAARHHDARSRARVRRFCWWTTTRPTSRCCIRRSMDADIACSRRRAERTRCRSQSVSLPDLIMLDVMMPEMDGFETCARLKAHPRTRDSRLIFLSALADSGDKVRGLELGGIDFVTNPFRHRKFIARVKTHLTLRDIQKQLRRRNEELEHELTVAQELLREARDRSEGVLLGNSARGRAPSAGCAGCREEWTGAADQRPAGL